MRTKWSVLALAAAAALGIVAQPAQADPCDSDVNGDGIVDVLDLLAVLADWGPCPGCPTDIIEDGVVDVLDLLQVLADWGQTCGIFDAELAGNPLDQYPYFEYVLAFNQGAPVHVAVDPSRYPQLVGQTGDIYVVEAKTTGQWAADKSLSDVTGGAQTESFVAGTIQDNTFEISGGDALSAEAGLDVGHPYDVVLDMNQSGELDSGDYIDGYDDTVHGMYAVHDLVLPGPLGVTEATYACPNWDGTPGYSAQNLFYPKLIDEMGELPLIIMSHGNGHNYQWYDHIGFHMASYGYVFMSHANNTMPGVFTASTTTLEHTDAFIRELPNIQGGKLVGHVDTSRITWVGHSRGGEGVAIAYDRIYDGTWVPEYYGIEDIKFISSIAPVDFLGTYQANPHNVPAYHLWTGGADYDVHGCASNDIAQTFHLHYRAEEYRQSIALHGVGHGDFHNGGSSSVAQGPCLVGRANTHKIMKGLLLPMVKHYIEGNVPGRDFLWRQYEHFRPIGVPIKECIVAQLMYQEGSAADNFMIDDYQSQTSTTISSSGGSVSYSVTNVLEGRLDDNNSTFTWTTSDPMNGMTCCRGTDLEKGVVFEWDTNAYYEFAIIAAEQDLTDDTCLSFRACQGTQHPNTAAALEDLTFTVVLRDGSGTESAINISAFGGGIEEPYQRVGTSYAYCGPNPGWYNDFETIRIRLTDFLNNDSGLDLSDIVAVRLNFGSSWGSAVGRLGLDEVEITKN